MRTLLLITLAAIFFTQQLFADFNRDKETVYQQYLEYNRSYPPADTLTAKYLSEMQEDGTFTSVDYKSTRRGDWPTTDHLVYIDEMARSYAHPASQFYQDKKLKDAILKGVQHWLDAGYKNKNWYPIQVRAPKHTLHIFLYMGDEIPQKMKAEAWEKMFKDLHMNRTGSNNVIAAENEIMKALIYDKKDVMDKAVEVIWSEVRQTTNEGIQPDWCFHQHGNQQQMGNYGLSYSERVTEWAYLLRNTSYALSADKLAIHRNFLLNGPSWFLWKGKMDINASGRQYKIGDLELKFDAFTKQLVLMQKIDPDNKSLYQQRINWPNKLTGHKSYWCSDFCVHREKNWMASLSMSSSRVVGTELCNMENFTGVHIGDGRLLVTQSGGEYHHIAPLWDWHRLPGTTCDQKLDTLTPQISTRTTSNFAGVIDNGKIGMASMIYNRKGLKAKKGWFFVGEAIVCLGSGITGHSSGNVITSVEQSNLEGEILSSHGLLLNGNLQLNADSWVYHNGIGYHILDKATITTSQIKENWQKCFPTHEDIAAEGSVFSIYIDHGKDPDSRKYAYCIYPEVDAGQMEKRIVHSKIRIVSNSETVQAIRFRKNLLAVFYAPGILKVDDKTTIEVDVPCLLIINKQEIRVSDPTHESTNANISISGHIFTAKLPQEAESGNCKIIDRK